MERAKQTYRSKKADGVKKSYYKPTQNKNQNQNTSAVAYGDMIIVENAVTKEKVKFKINDTKNPFIGKTFRDTVKLKGEDYRIYMVNGKRF